MLQLTNVAVSLEDLLCDLPADEPSAADGSNGADDASSKCFVVALSLEFRCRSWLLAAASGVGKAVADEYNPCCVS